MVKIVAIEKKLKDTKPITQIHFDIGWLRIQLIVFCLLGAITGNRPEALVNLRYRYLQLNLIRDPSGDRPRLFIEFTAEYTTGYLDSKDANTFPIPEIIYDPTLVLSPHVFLLGILFKAKAFKSPSIDCLEKLYSLNVLNGLNEQKLPLREELDDEFIFCRAIREADGIHIAREQQATTDWFRYRMKKGGEITGMDQGLNESREYRSPQLTRPLLIKYFYMADPEKDLMKFTCSMSKSIDPRRPCYLTKE
ncbi:hypothetical protein B0J14DRAFT_614152 [Halenospora varia]|nr:hypothetical protein B0J14DRAFT_614152 [Halenospora varia]